jgi:hypothetical protein
MGHPSSFEIPILENADSKCAFLEEGRKHYCRKIQRRSNVVYFDIRMPPVLVSWHLCADA